LHESTNAQVFINPNGEPISAVQVEITYNPDVVTVDSIKPGNFFTDIAPATILKQSIHSNSVEFVYSFPIDQNQYSSTESGSLADISFTAVGTGYNIMNIPVGVEATLVKNIYGEDVLSEVTAGLITVLKPCPGDFNQDQVVNVFDFMLLATNFLKTNPEPPEVDTNRDGIVNIFDFAVLAENFTKSCQI